MIWAKIILIILFIVDIGTLIANYKKEKRSAYDWKHIVMLVIIGLLYYCAGIFDFIKLNMK